MLLFAIVLTILKVDISCMFGWNNEDSKETEHIVKCKKF